MHLYSIQLLASTLRSLLSQIFVHPFYTDEKAWRFRFDFDHFEDEAWQMIPTHDECLAGYVFVHGGFSVRSSVHLRDCCFAFHII